MTDKSIPDPDAEDDPPELMAYIEARAYTDLLWTKRRADVVEAAERITLEAAESRDDLSDDDLLLLAMTRLEVARERLRGANGG